MRTIEGICTQCTRMHEFYHRRLRMPGLTDQDARFLDAGDDCPLYALRDHAPRARRDRPLRAARAPCRRGAIGNGVAGTLRGAARAGAQTGAAPRCADDRAAPVAVHGTTFDEGAIFMRADRIEGSADKSIEASGKVELRTRRETVLADWLQYDFLTDEIWGKGDV